jgi:hypothetical protein
MKSNLLKNLMAKFGKKGAGSADDVGAAAARSKAAGLGGDDMEAGFGNSFRPGATPSAFEPTMGAGAGMGGAMGPANSQRPFSEWEILKQKLARMSPEQKAALVGAGGGLAAGGLGGYIAGDIGE